MITLRLKVCLLKRLKKVSVSSVVGACTNSCLNNSIKRHDYTFSSMYSRTQLGENDNW
jgi:hypothetical protein